MKILLTILLAIAIQQCPADSSPNRFYPNHNPMHSKRHYALSLNGLSPQIQYGAPSKLTQSSGIKIPGGLTIEDLIRLTEKLQREKFENKFHIVRPNKPQKVTRPSPSIDYKTITDFDNVSQKLTPPRTSYGVPIQPQNEYGVPISNTIEPLNKYQTIAFSNQENMLQSNNYKKLSVQRLPVKYPADFRHQQNNVNFNQNQNYIPPNHNNQNLNNPVPNQGNYGVTPKHSQNHFNAVNPTSFNSFNNVNQQPNGVNSQFMPQTPNEGNTQNFNSQSPYLNTNFAQIPMHPNSNIQPTQTNTFNNNHQPNNGDQFNNNPTHANGRYLPPTTTTGSVFTQATTERPEQSTTVETTDAGQEENNNQFTELPPTAVDSQDPNVSIATAVAGADPNLFYLQQPDGRLQKVILQKTQDPSGKPEEYTANYYFQNIEAIPNVIYSPLITLG